jgi:hypothetical protein
MIFQPFFVFVLGWVCFLPHQNADPKRGEKMFKMLYPRWSSTWTGKMTEGRWLQDSSSLQCPHCIKLDSLKKGLNWIQEKVVVGIFFSLLFPGSVGEDGELEKYRNTLAASVN